MARYKYSQPEYFAVKRFAERLEQAATHWKDKWKNTANVRMCEDFIHVARSMIECVENDTKFTPGVMVQIALPNFVDDDFEYGVHDEDAF